MITPKKLLEMARKRQKIAARWRRRNSSSSDAAADSTASIADEGHFVVYAIDGVRFVVPLACLESPIFVELFRMAEEEFGLPGNGPIVLPCAEAFLEYAVSLTQRSVSEDVEKALLASIASGQCSRSALQHGLANQQIYSEAFNNNACVSF